MSFEDLLRKKLGPMRDLVRREPRPDPPVYDPSTLFYRRAVGLEARARPEETWARIELGRVDRPAKTLQSLDAKLAGIVLGMTSWTHASALPLSPDELWSLVDRDLLFYARFDPRISLTGRSGVLTDGRRIARRASMWPTAAIETAVAIAPMSFMPRGDDLRGAEHVGYRFASLERGFEVFGATISGTKKTGAALRALIPLLDGSFTYEQLATSQERKNMLELLDRLTVLEAIDAPPSRIPPASKAHVAWLGHGAVLLQAGGANVLFDPLFFSISEPEERGVSPAKFDPRSLPDIDAVFITHGDNDHLNANSLAQLPASTPIYIPPIGATPAAYQVDIRGMLRVLGFDNVYELDHRAGVVIRDLTVSAWPFAGEDWDLPLAKSTYLAESDDASVFLSADSAPMDDVYRELAARGRKVDLAFMGVSGSAETMVMPDGFGYGNFYREWIPRVRHNEWVRHCSTPEDAARSVEILGPRFAFGYAAGGASFIRTEYSDTGDHQTFAQLIKGAVSLPLGSPVAIENLAEITSRL